MEPLLIGVLQRRRQRGHDLPAVSEVAPNLGPFLLLADALKAASGLNSLLELVKVKRAFVHTRKARQVVAVLLVELGQLVEVVEIGTRACSTNQS